MAWQDVQKTMKLLSALSEFGGKGFKGSGKDGPKGGGKNGKHGAATQKQRLCPWADCAAANKKQATWGGAAACHCCRRAFSATPPIEKLVDWAYEEKLKASPTKRLDDGKGAKDKGKGKSAGKGKGPAATPPGAAAAAASP